MGILRNIARLIPNGSGELPTANLQNSEHLRSYKMYKLVKTPYVEEIRMVLWNNSVYVPFDPANIDYAKFKRDINDNKDKLQDADGNEMSAADAKAYVATLP